MNPERLEPTVNRYVEQLINGLRKDLARNGGVVEMSKWFHNFSFDVRVVLYNAHRSPGRCLWGKIFGPWKAIVTNRIGSSILFMELSLTSISLFPLAHALILAHTSALGGTDFANYAHTYTYKGNPRTLYGSEGHDTKVSRFN
jgi:hypothetical protein